MFDLQKANIGKRISAFLFDIILLFTFTVGFAWAIFGIADYDKYGNGFNEIKAQYIAEYESKYNGIDLDISDEEYKKLSADAKAVYDEALAAANEAFGKDEGAAYNYGMMINIIMIAVPLGVLLSYLILEFAIPLFLRNGQTLGKKIFGVALMYTNGVKVTPVGLFIRTVLGKYTVETMVPLMIIALIFLGKLGFVGTVVLFLLLALELGLLIFNKTRPMIHDALATTVCVDMASQMIFENEAELIEYKKKVHEEAAERAKYLN